MRSIQGELPTLLSTKTLAETQEMIFFFLRVKDLSCVVAKYLEVNVKDWLSAITSSTLHGCEGTAHIVYLSHTISFPLMEPLPFELHSARLMGSSTGQAVYRLHHNSWENECMIQQLHDKITQRLKTNQSFRIRFSCFEGGTIYKALDNVPDNKEYLALQNLREPVTLITEGGTTMSVLGNFVPTLDDPEEQDYLVGDETLLILVLSLTSKPVLGLAPNSSP